MFKTIIKISLASLLRRRTRSILLVTMIAVSLWGLLFMEGIYDGMTRQMIDNAIRSDSGHLSLFAGGYRLDPDLHNWIEEPTDLDAFLKADKRVKSFAARLLQDGLAATAHYSHGVRLIGIDPLKEKKHGRLAAYLYSGEFDFGKKERGAIIGFKLANKLQVALGSKIIVSAQDGAGEVSSTPLKISGILKTNNMGLDENGVFLAEKTMRRLLSKDKGAGQIAVILKDDEQIHAIQQDLKLKFADLDILRWDELYPALLQSKVMMEGFSLVTNLLIFCAAALGIFGVMLVSVLERLREFGIMMAIGTGFNQIGTILFTESFLLGLTGFGLGALLGLITLYYFKIYGLDLSIFSDALDEFGVDAITYGVIRPGYFITALIAVVLATFFSVLLPLRILKRTRPIDAINTI